MIILVLTALLWLAWGWSLSRYVLGIRDLFTLLPMSLGLGLILHILALNALLYHLDSQTGYWVSLVLLSLPTLWLAFTRHQAAAPLHLGLPRWEALLVLAVVGGVWLLSLPALVVAHDLDANYHYNFAGLIAAQGLPLLHPWNPENCSFYHYGANVLAGVLFRVSGVSIGAAFDWIVASAMASIMLLVVNLMWWISPKRSVMGGLVGVCIFLFATSAMWFAYPLQIPAIRERLPESDLVHYLDHLNREEIAYQSEGIYYLGGALVNPFIVMYHTRSIVFSTLTMLLILGILLRIELGTPARWGVWLIVALLLGMFPLFYETFWTVPVGTIAFYALHRLWKKETPWQNIVYPTLFILGLGGAIGLFLGGPITDYLFCGGGDIDPANADLPFLNLALTPRYYSLLRELVFLDSPANVLRWFVEWGLLMPLLPVMIYHYLYRRQNVLLAALLVNLAIPTFGLLFTENLAGFLTLSLPRFAFASLSFAGVFVADWLVWERRRAWWVRLGMVLIFLGLCWGGWLQFAEQIIAPRGVEPDLLTPLESKVQAEWFGRVGGREDVILNLRPQLLEDGMGTLFGNYSLITVGRVNLTTFPFIIALRENPHPDFLNYYGIDYIYFNESWWNWAYEAFRQQVVNQPDRFEQVFWREEEGQISALYRVLPSPDPFCASCQVCIQWFGLEERPLNVEEIAQIQGEWAGIVGEAETFLPFPRSELGVAAYLEGLSDSNEVADQSALEAWRATKSAVALQEMGFDHLLLPRSWFRYASEADLASLEAEYELVNKWDCPLLVDYLLLYKGR